MIMHRNIAFIMMCILHLTWGTILAEKTPTIQSIEVNGNELFSDSEILGRMNLRPGTVFSSETLYQDVASILQQYVQAGYFMAEVSPPKCTYSEDSSHVSLVLHIDEGQQIQVGRIEIVGNRHFDDTMIFGRFETQDQQTFSGPVMEKDIDDLLRLYEENGYPFCRIEPGTFRIETAERVDLRLNITEGPRLQIGDILVQGNKTTKKHVIIRETRLQRGETYKQSKIDGAQRRLERLGYFSRVSPLSIASVRGDTVSLTLEVNEGKTSTINGLIGYTPAQGNHEGYITGLVDLSLTNLLGTGRKVDAFWHRRAPSSADLAFGYEEPWILGMPIGVGVALEQIDQDSTYVLTRARVTLRAALTDHLEGRLQFGWERVVPDSSGATFLARSTKYTAGTQVAYDTRDVPTNPRQGLYYRTSIEYGRKRNRATDYYVPERVKIRTSKFTLDLEHFVPTFSRQTIAVALHGREFRSGEKPVPVAEHFRLGGATSLRGYREDQFTGTRLAWANIEYRHLVTVQSRAFLFLDVGTYFREQADPDTGQLEKVNRRKFGYGLGFRVESRVGIIGIDFGLGEGDSFSQGKIHVRTENRF